MNLVLKLLLFSTGDQQFELLHELANRNALLMRVDQPHKFLAAGQPARRDGNGVFVLSDENPSEFRRSLQEVFVASLASSVSLAREYIHSTTLQSF